MITQYAKENNAPVIMLQGTVHEDCILKIKGYSTICVVEGEPQRCNNSSEG